MKLTLLTLAVIAAFFAAAWGYILLVGWGLDQGRNFGTLIVIAPFLTAVAIIISIGIYVTTQGES